MRFLATLQSFLKSISTKNSFAQNFSFVASGKLAVAISSFFFVPLLARLYPPEAYGNFTIFNSIATISVTLVLAGYPASYVLIKEKRQFQSIVFFQLLVIISISIILGLIILLINSLVSIPNIWIYLPFGIFTGGIMIIFSNWNIREREFKLSAKLEGIGGVFLRSVNALIGWIGNGYVYGLILGNLIGRTAANLVNFGRFWKVELANQPISFSKKDLIQALKEYKNYPKFILPNQLLRQLSGQIPIYFLAIVFNNQQLGYYGMALTLFSLPMQMLTNAVSPIFLQKANELYSENTWALQKFTKKLLRTIQGLIVAPFIIGIVFSNELIHFLLGAKWEQTSSLVSIMAFPVFMSLAVNPFTSIFQIFKKERLILMIDLFANVLIIISLVIAQLIDSHLALTIALLSVANVISIGIKGLLICRNLNISFIKNIVSYFVLLCLLSGFLYYLKIQF